jgi:hypothetical protein
MKAQTLLSMNRRGFLKKAGSELLPLALCRYSLKRLQPEPLRMKSSGLHLRGSQ